MGNKQYAFIFAGIVCVTCSLLLAVASQGLKPQQELNRKVDIQRNILRSVGISGAEGKALTAPEVLSSYEANIRELVISTSGEIVPGLTPAQLAANPTAGQLPLFVHVKDGAAASVVIPVSGKGLWSTIYGYLAIEPDGVTVKGITFYKHGETPGLGGEVEASWFQSNFVGKKIFDENGELTAVSVAKGRIVDVVPEKDREHWVDGISGATLTGKGVTNFLRHELHSYEPFLKNLQTKPLELKS